MLMVFPTMQVSTYGFNGVMMLTNIIWLMVEDRTTHSCFKSMNNQNHENVSYKPQTKSKFKQK